MRYMSAMSEFIKREPQDEDAWVCNCGNMPHVDGFSPCDKNGKEVEPDEKWEDLYICLACNRIINMHTLEVIGVADSFQPLP